jgi:hypothetical protein
MKNFEVIIRETRARVVTISADNRDDAERIVNEQYEAGEIHLNNNLIHSSVAVIPFSFKGKALEAVRVSIKRDIGGKFISEVIRLLNSGGVDHDDFLVGTVFRVAAENVADGYNHGKDSAYENLKHY